jgi:hypothetical protein
MGEVFLNEVDKAEISVIVDNYSDLFLADSDTSVAFNIL